MEDHGREIGFNPLNDNDVNRAAAYRTPIDLMRAEEELCHREAVAAGEELAVKVFSSGASSSEEQPRYDLIPLETMKALASRHALGGVRHGEWNFEKGVADPVFIRDRYNHMIEHAMKAALGDTSEDHLAAVLCNASMLVHMRAMRDSGRK